MEIIVYNPCPVRVLLSSILNHHKRDARAQVSYKPAAVRALYFGLSFLLSLEQFLSLSLSIDKSLSQSLYLYRSLYRSFYRSLNLEIFHSTDLFLDLDLFLDFDQSLSLDQPLSLDPELRDSLQQLKEQIPDINKDEKGYMKWWQTNGKNWAEELRYIMIKYRNVGHDWQFSKEQKELLQQYHDANKFLLECLNSDCYVSRDMRQYIEDTLLLPIAEIKPYE